MTLEPMHLMQPMQMPGATSAGDAIKPADPAYRKRVEEAAVQFEGLFIAQMLNEMKKATDQLKSDDSGTDRTSNAMLDYANRAVADAIAHQRAFGIADTLAAQMLPPEAASAAPPAPAQD